jgi:type I restriction enzyme R subunit
MGRVKIPYYVAKNSRGYWKPTSAMREAGFEPVIIDHLTEHGIIEAERLYESPFTDLNPRGVEGLFDAAQVNELLSVISRIRAAAA